MGLLCLNLYDLENTFMESLKIYTPLGKDCIAFLAALYLEVQMSSTSFFIFFLMG